MKDTTNFVVIRRIWRETIGQTMMTEKSIAQSYSYRAGELGLIHSKIADY